MRLFQTICFISKLFYHKKLILFTCFIIIFSLSLFFLNFPFPANVKTAFAQGSNYWSLVKDGNNLNVGYVGKNAAFKVTPDGYFGIGNGLYGLNPEFMMEVRPYIAGKTNEIVNLGRFGVANDATRAVSLYQVGGAGLNSDQTPNNIESYLFLKGKLHPNTTFGNPQVTSNFGGVAGLWVNDSGLKVITSTANNNNPATPLLAMSINSTTGNMEIRGTGTDNTRTGNVKGQLHITQTSSAQNAPAAITFSTGYSYSGNIPVGIIGLDYKGTGGEPYLFLGTTYDTSKGITDTAMAIGPYSRVSMASSLGIGGIGYVSGDNSSRLSVHGDDGYNDGNGDAFRVNNRGSVWANAFYAGPGNTQLTSDQRLKENIAAIPDALQKVLNLRGISFTWKKGAYSGITNVPQGKQIGVIAQEVEKVLPELVSTDPNGYKSVAYQNLTAVLIEAIKQQQKEITTQQQEMQNLKKEVEILKNR